MPNQGPWSPGGSAFNASGKELKDHVSVLNINKLGTDGMYGLHTLDISGGYARYANGIIKGHGNLIHVVNSSNGRTSVFSIQSDHSLLKVDQINVNLPMDNLSIESNGDIFAHGFPNAFSLGRALQKPLTIDVPLTVFRIRSKDDLDGKRSFEFTKVLEDVEGKLMHRATDAVHDTKTGNTWLSGVMSPFLTVCGKQGTVDS